MGVIVLFFRPLPGGTVSSAIVQVGAEKKKKVKTTCNSEIKLLIWFSVPKNLQISILSEKFPRIAPQCSFEKLQIQNEK